MMNISDEQRLTRLIEKFGENSRVVSRFRDQMAAHKRGQSSQEMYITGMMKKDPGRDK